MFINLLFLILFLIIVNIGIGVEQTFTSEISVGHSLLLGCGLYLLTLGVIALQNSLTRLSRGRALLLANLELLAFFLLFYFSLSGIQLWRHLPWVGTFDSSVALGSLLLYFIGLALFHWTATPLRLQSRRDYVSAQIRFLAPFVLPFILFMIVADLYQLLPLPRFHELLSQGGLEAFEDLFLTLATILFMFLMVAILPYPIQKIWLCQPLEHNELEKRLEELCQKAKFTHAGMKRWTIMRNMHTAAIVGVIPQLRYVIFTESLMEQLSPDQVEAVLAHEIGHSKHKHLLIYPFIILGLAVTLSLASSLTAPSVSAFFDLLEQKVSSAYLITLFLCFEFLFLAGLVALYLRLVFGYFSRLFERQADLYVFAVDVPAAAMIGALDTIGWVTGNTHRHPSWHHYSIQQRIDFLKDAEATPSLIEKHNRKVRRSLMVYSVLLLLGALAAFFV